MKSKMRQLEGTKFEIPSHKKSNKKGKVWDNKEKRDSQKIRRKYVFRWYYCKEKKGKGRKEKIKK